MTRAPLLAWGVWVLNAAITGCGIALIATTPSDEVPVGLHVEQIAPYLVMQLAFMTVGALVGAHRPENPIGWLLSGVGLLSAFQYLSGGYAVFGLVGPASVLPLAEVAAWIFSWSGAGLGVLCALVVLLFPDGRFTARGKLGAVAAAAGGAQLFVYLSFRPGPLLNFPSLENPFAQAWPMWAFDAQLGVVLLLFLASGAAAIDSLRVRLRRSNGVERQQLKWFLGGVLLAWVVLAPAFPLAFVNWELAKYLFAFSVTAMPISVGIAILRYGLYDIDLLINRTVVYGVTSAAIAATFFGGIVALQTVLRPLTSESEVAIAASTLVSFALFQPIRRRVQDIVDGRFDRSRYDAARTLDAFSDRLRDEVELDRLRADLLGAVRQTMSPAHTSLWLRELPRNDFRTAGG